MVKPVDDCWEPVWQIGDVETVGCPTETPVLLTNYADEFNWGTVGAVPCNNTPTLRTIAPVFTDPFIVGTTPTNEFPYNSNANFPYATDFDVEWPGGLPFGGLLTVSWSPGKSFNDETKVVNGDGIPTDTTFIQDGTPISGMEYFMNTYPVYEDSVALSALANGDHTINFVHTQGDGTYWDWIRLEKPCEEDETAWGAGVDFPGRNWATYFTYHVQGLVGDWALQFVWEEPFEATYDHGMTIDMQNADGTFSGTGGYPLGGPYSKTWTVSGDVTGNSVSMTITYDLPSTYVATLSGTVAADGNSMSGTFSGTGPNWPSGTWTATRVP